MANNNDSDDDIIAAAAVTVMAAGAACIAAIRSWNWLDSTSSGSSSSSSSKSTARTRRPRKRRRELESEIESLSSQISEAKEAVKSREDFSSKLYSEIMKCEGYDEVSLGKAFDYLLEHQKLGRGFLAKSDALRQAWLADFFSSKDSKH